MEKMNSYIVMKASTNSEWDGVDFALLKVDTEIIDRLLSTKKLVEILKGEPDEIEIYGDEVDFFTDAEQLPGRIVFDTNKSDSPMPMVIELNELEKTALNRPKQTIKHGNVSYGIDDIKFSAFGKCIEPDYWCITTYRMDDIKFSGFVKNTGVEYWCTITWEFLVAQKQKMIPGISNV